MINEIPRDAPPQLAGGRFTRDISVRDWTAFLGHLNATLDAFQVPATECGQVLGFIESTKADIVEV